MKDFYTHAHTHTPSRIPPAQRRPSGPHAANGGRRDRGMVKLTLYSYLCLSPRFGGPTGKGRESGKAGPQGAGHLAPESRGATPKNYTAQVPDSQRASPLAHGSTCQATEKARGKKVQHGRSEAARR